MSGSTLTVLGDLHLVRDGVEVDLGPPKQRTVLAVLALHAGLSVSPEVLVSVLWGEDPPANSANVVQRHIGGVRRLFEPALGRRATGQWLVSAASGYRLDLGPENSDLLRFRAMVKQARAARSGQLLVTALGLWRGRVAAGVDLGLECAALVASIERERSQAAIEAAELGSADPSDELLEVLRAAAAADLLNEPLQAALIRCLNASGHRAEALSSVQALRQRLDDELGIEPGAEVQNAFLTALRSGPGHAGARIPARLPPRLATFSGREVQLQKLDQIRAVHDGRHDAGLAVLHGMGGVGKTSAAVRWAQLNAERFPDGQLFIDLHGFHPDRRPIDAFEALPAFLSELGVPAAQIPETLEGRLARFRELLTGRRVLLVLDNVRDPDQIRPLLPPVPGTFTLITSRSRLAGLVAGHGAVPVLVDVHDPVEARTMLLRRLGLDGLPPDEEKACTEIVELCAGLPLAISVVAARLLTGPGFTLRAVADDMRASRSLLGAFDVGDSSVGVRSTLRWSYEALSDSGKLAFRLASVFRAYEGSLDLMCSICEFTPEQARTTLSELIDVRLLEEHRPGRYRSHDLICAFSFEMCTEVDGDASRRAARNRLVDYYTRSLRVATGVLNQNRTVPSGNDRAGHPAEITARLPDTAAARAWFSDEHLQIFATLRDLRAESYGDPSHDRFHALAGALQEFEEVLDGRAP